MENGTVVNLRDKIPCDNLGSGLYWDAPVRSRAWPVKEPTAIRGCRKYCDPSEWKPLPIIAVYPYWLTVGANFDLLANSVEVTILVLAENGILCYLRLSLTSNGDEPVFWLGKILVVVSDKSNRVDKSLHIKDDVVISGSPFNRHLASDNVNQLVCHNQIRDLGTACNSWLKVLEVCVCVSWVGIGSDLADVQILLFWHV